MDDLCLESRGSLRKYGLVRGMVKHNRHLGNSEGMKVVMTKEGSGV